MRLDAQLDSGGHAARLALLGAQKVRSVEDLKSGTSEFRIRSCRAGALESSGRQQKQRRERSGCKERSSKKRRRSRASDTARRCQMAPGRQRREHTRQEVSRRRRSIRDDRRQSINDDDNNNTNNDHERLGNIPALFSNNGATQMAAAAPAAHSSASSLAQTMSSLLMMNSFHTAAGLSGSSSSPSSSFQHSSPLHSFMSAAALAGMAATARHQQQQQQQQQQRHRDFILSRFASLHGLSAVATAIQQSSQAEICSSSQPNVPNQHNNNQRQQQQQQQQHNPVNLGLAGEARNGRHLNQHHLDCLTRQVGMLTQSLESSSSQVPYHSGHIAAASTPQLQLQTSLPVVDCRHHFSAGAVTSSLSHPAQVLIQDHLTSVLPAHLTSAHARRPRRRGARKCRKIYGMAQKQIWCNQCKWKKACSRFLASPP